jgi:hypothetical protein
MGRFPMMAPEPAAAKDSLLACEIVECVNHFR